MRIQVFTSESAKKTPPVKKTTVAKRRINTKKQGLMQKQKLLLLRPLKPTTILLKSRPSLLL